MASVSFGKFAKRRNSTKQPASLPDTRTVTLKEACSQDRPVFICTGNDFDYNYCMWNNKYYFIDEIISLHNSLIEIHCIMDPLATYKTAITSSTQFVSYSAGGTRTVNQWVEDSRMTIRHSASVSSQSASMGTLFTDGGFYVLSVVGKNGCDVWAIDSVGIAALLDQVNDWKDDLEDEIFYDHTYDFTTIENALESVSKINMRTGIAGNAYAEAPACIRSCIWVPFFAGEFAGNSAEIYLGQFATGVTKFKCKTDAQTGSTTVNIPWHYTGWRRAKCEEVYLYLPLVGMVSIPSDEIVGESSITVEWSATATDGCIAYRVVSGSQVIGTYGANASVNYPIGISQQASAGQIVQTAFAGAEKMVSSGLQAASSINPAGWVAGGVALGMDAVSTEYNVLDTALSRHNSCIGGIGGGAGIGLSLSLYCYTVVHATNIPEAPAPPDPAPATLTNYIATMGEPIMRAISLSTCSGFTQCANAHVEADATAGELNAIDSMLNSGFYIE